MASVSLPLKGRGPGGRSERVTPLVTALTQQFPANDRQGKERWFPMKAVRLFVYNEPVKMVDVPDPKIEAPTDVIVKIGGAGVCRTDLHIIEAVWREALGNPALPYTIGHENAGWIEEVGSGVTNLKKGDPVILHPLRSCGLCRACRAGYDMYCEQGIFPGLDGTDGGYAEYLKTSVRSVIKLAPGTDPVPLAPFADAGITAYHAVKRVIADT